jgi:hypothetical protein
MTPRDLNWRRAQARTKNKREKRMQEKAAKQIVSSDTQATTSSAETKKITDSNPQIVQGGLPGSGKGGD